MLLLLSLPTLLLLPLLLLLSPSMVLLLLLLPLPMLLLPLLPLLSPSTDAIACHVMERVSMKLGLRGCCGLWMLVGVCVFFW
jgi:hypothetical protein